MVTAPTPRIDELAARVERTLRGRCGLAPGTPLALAVSGGADSVALARLVAALGRWPVVGVLFVDHGLRPVEDERDAARGAAELIGAPFHEARLELAPGGNLQARARRARYQALLRLTPRGAFLATGHTLTDQAETVLLRLLRGSGVSGLAGLAPRRGRTVRPLLEIRRDETRAVAERFRDDPTNTSPRFARNRVRALLGQLMGENARIEEALGELARGAAGATTLLDALARAVPDLDLGGLDADTAAAYAHHLARAATGGRSAASGAAIRAWAEGLVAGGVGRASLGDALAGVYERGHAWVEADDDPRRVIVATAPGTYRAAAMDLTLEQRPPVGPDGPRAEVALRAPDLAWPLTVRPAPGGRRRDEDVDDAAEAGWIVVDAAGRTLASFAAGLGEAAAGATRTGHWGPARAARNGAPQSEVVGSPSGPVTSAPGRQVVTDRTSPLPEGAAGPTETRQESPHARLGRSS